VTAATRARRVRLLDEADALLARSTVTVDALARADALLDQAERLATSARSEETLAAASSAKDVPRLVLPGPNSRGVELVRRHVEAALDAMGIEEAVVVRWLPRSELSASGGAGATHGWEGDRHVIELSDDAWCRAEVARRLVHELHHCADMECYGPEGFRASYDEQQRTVGYWRNQHERGAREAVERWRDTFCRGTSRADRIYRAKYELARGGLGA
jgi:hypothetical protein